MAPGRRVQPPLVLKLPGRPHAASGSMQRRGGAAGRRLADGMRSELDTTCRMIWCSPTGNDSGSMAACGDGGDRCPTCVHDRERHGTAASSGASWPRRTACTFGTRHGRRISGRRPSISGSAPKGLASAFASLPRWLRAVRRDPVSQLATYMYSGRPMHYPELATLLMPPQDRSVCSFAG